MNNLRTLIVDDEPLALKLLRAKLNKVPNIEIVGECKNGREAIAATLELAPDIIFLDIQMPGLDGFDVVKSLQNDVLPLIVFTTAYEQYALDAFDVHAVDYILKPLDDERIARAVQRAQKRFEGVDGQNNKPRILGAIDSINQRENSQQLTTKRLPGSLSTDTFMDKKVVIRDRDEITILKQSEIEWVDAAGDYVCLHAEGQTHIKRSTLKELLSELDENIFKRVHRSTIVNLNFIDKVIPHTKGEFFLLLGEFEKIKVSRNYKDAIKDFLLGE